jgi:methylthioxylose transferase
MESAPTTDLAVPARTAWRTAPRSALSAGLAPALALGAWAALIALGWAWGSELNADGATISLGAPPLFGRWDLRLGPEIIVPISAAVAIAIAVPTACRTLRWPGLVAAAGLAAFGWALALALTDGLGGINLPLEGPSEYLPAVGLVGSPGELLSTFTERIGDYTTHVRSHPPGMLLALWGLDEIGLGGSWPAALLVIAVGASAAPAALITMRAVAGEGPARRAAPFLVLVPAAVWIATTADAFYMGIGAWAVAVSVLAIVDDGRRSDLLATGGGLLFGACVFLSYGLVLLAAIPLAVAVAGRRLRPLLFAAAGSAVVMLAFLAAGFWWLDGFFAIREQYLSSIAQTRPYDFFVVNNLAAFGLALGPVAALGLARLRDRRGWLLVGGAVAGVLLADLSGMSKAEVERIWLPFVPWVLLAATALPSSAGWVRALLGAQAACAIAIQVGVRTIW